MKEKSSMLSAQNIRLIALDLDGTLLNSDKVLTPRTHEALAAAAKRGIEIVPASGRIYRGMPESIRELPFVRYVIAVNGAQVFDTKNGETLYSAAIPTEEALAVYEYLDTQDVIYDCYLDGWGYMTEAMQNRAAEHISNVHTLRMARELRTPVPELKAYLKNGRYCPHKLQLFTHNIALRDELLRSLPHRFPQLAISTSLPNNIEINSREAVKGHALRGLAESLGLELRQTMAFGDGLNDMSMICSAGIGVAMGNAHPDILAAADIVAEDCDSEGVAKVIEQLLAG